MANQVSPAQCYNHAFNIEKALDESFGKIKK